MSDRRNFGGPVAIGGGVIGVIALLINFLLGGDVDPSAITTVTREPVSAEAQAAEDQHAEFVKVVLAETEDVWNRIFQEHGARYKEPRLVLFRGMVESACGSASAAVGPFYCPADQQIYIDLSFYDDLSSRFGAPGDFAMAYVIAHEVGHHIQLLDGTAERMQRLRQQLSEEEYNRYSVMQELQADFYAGVWAHYASRITTSDGRKLIEPGDIEEALGAANAIGDDRLQQQAQGHVVPESFTHGTSAQRAYWFRKGFETGDISQGDTFSSANLR